MLIDEAMTKQCPPPQCRTPLLLQGPQRKSRIRRALLATYCGQNDINETNGGVTEGWRWWKVCGGGDRIAEGGSLGERVDDSNNISH